MMYISYEMGKFKLFHIFKIKLSIGNVCVINLIFQIYLCANYNFTVIIPGVPFILILLSDHDFMYYIRQCRIKSILYLTG